MMRARGQDGERVAKERRSRRIGLIVLQLTASFLRGIELEFR